MNCIASECILYYEDTDRQINLNFKEALLLKISARNCSTLQEGKRFPCNREYKNKYNPIQSFQVLIDNISYLVLILRQQIYYVFSNHHQFVKKRCFANYRGH